MIFNSDSKARVIATKLTVIARHLRQSFDQRVEGPTRAKWTTIVAVAKTPGATQRMIASSLQVTEVTAGRLIDRLCNDGLLERREHPQDRRAYRVYTTDAASPLLERLDEIAALGEAEAFDGFSEQELTRLLDYMDRIMANLARARPQTSPGKAAPEREILVAMKTKT